MKKANEKLKGTGPAAVAGAAASMARRGSVQPAAAGKAGAKPAAAVSPPAQAFQRRVSIGGASVTHGAWPNGV